MRECGPGLGLCGGSRPPPGDSARAGVSVVSCCHRLVLEREQRVTLSRHESRRRDPEDERARDDRLLSSTAVRLPRRWGTRARAAQPDGRTETLGRSHSPRGPTPRGPCARGRGFPACVRGSSSTFYKGEVLVYSLVVNLCVVIGDRRRVIGQGRIGSPRDASSCDL